VHILCVAAEILAQKAGHAERHAGATIPQSSQRLRRESGVAVRTQTPRSPQSSGNNSKQKRLLMLFGSAW